MFSSKYKWSALLLVLIGLVGCSSGGGRYSMSEDRAPSQRVDVSSIKDAVPRVEPKSRGGNKSPYRVLGKTYYVMDSAYGYRERGGASWYGKKFHGHTTSNGEVYNMYSMTAAHKSLPLPTYVRVTNLHNGRQVIVRVNDRGPFHPGRIIDLSYAAAAKLDMLKNGTAQVEVEAIDARAWQRQSIASASATQPPYRATAPAASAGRYLQVGAYGSMISAERVMSDVRALTGETVVIQDHTQAGRVLYRVQLGPLAGESRARELIGMLEQAGYAGARLVDLRESVQ